VIIGWKYFENLERAVRKNHIIDSPQTYTTDPDCMNYFNTKLSKTALKDIPCFRDEDFLNILRSQQIASIIEDNIPAYRERIFTPTITLAMFLKQALSIDRSCTQVVNEFIIDNLDGLPKNISKSTGSFCRSRQKLPLQLIEELVRYTGSAINEKIGSRKRIKGRFRFSYLSHFRYFLSRKWCCG
jgi:hypothetical protein